jgi:hypothetical protein
MCTIGPRWRRLELDQAQMSASGTKRKSGGGRASSALPQFSDINLFGNREGIVYFDAQIPDGAFNLGMTEKKLNGAKIARAAIDQRRLRASQRVSSK